VVFHDSVFDVYRVTGIKAEGPAVSLLSDAHRQFDIDRKHRRPDRLTRRFSIVPIPFSAKNAGITGWQGREISPVLRSNGELFWKIEVDVLEPVQFAEEVIDSEKFYEGSVCRITVNAYERNPIARAKCIEHYGSKCVICGFDFGDTFGEFARGFIHVHHTKPLSDIREQYEVDPIADLRPVCPNCHAAIHLGSTCRSIDEVSTMLRSDNAL
jgi:predicted HNH restriction endonuclease